MSYRDWYPSLGDYVWWKDRLAKKDRLARVTGEALATNYDWWISTFDGEYPDEAVFTGDLTPIAELQVIALLAAERYERSWSTTT